MDFIDPKTFRVWRLQSKYETIKRFRRGYQCHASINLLNSFLDQQATVNSQPVVTFSGVPNVSSTAGLLLVDIIHSSQIILQH